MRTLRTLMMFVPTLFLHAGKSPGNAVTVEGEGVSLRPSMTLGPPTDIQRVVYRNIYRVSVLECVPTKLVLYPREPHGLGERAHRLDCMERPVSWFEAYVKR